MAGDSIIGSSVNGQAPTISRDAVMKASAPIPEGVPEVSGVEWNHYNDHSRNGETTNCDITVHEMVANMASMGFQAGAVGDAVRIVNEMVRAPETTFYQDRKCAATDLLHRKTGETLKRGQKRLSFWDTHPTSSPRVSAQHYGGLSNIGTSLPLSPQLAVSKRISSNALAQLISPPSLLMEQLCANKV